MFLSIISRKRLTNLCKIVVRSFLYGTHKNRVAVFNNVKFYSTEIAKAIADFDDDDNITAIIVTGNGENFCAGGDIKEVQNRTYSVFQKKGFLNEWDDVYKCRKPVIAAVNGYALGGGFEFALLCDIIYASEKAKFSFLELMIGIVCGGGGTQRLVRSISKTKVMELALTAEIVDAHRAMKLGFVSKVCPVEKLLEESIKLADKIGTNCPRAVRLAKQAMNQAYETTLQDGLHFERSLFYSTK